MTFDVAIIGGSFAGLSAALPLARARRCVAIFDHGLRRNRFAAASHGFFGQDGRAPSDMVAEARKQLAAYPTVTWFDAEVTAIRGNTQDGFQVQSDGPACQASRLVLATGVADELPAIPGLQERWGRSVFHCPYCHGYELDRGRIGVIAAGPASLHHAALLPEWGKVVFFLNQAVVLDPAEEQALRDRGVRIEPSPVAAITDDATVRLADGRREVLAGLFVASRTRPSSPVAQWLGCELEPGPVGTYVKTSPMKETTVPGVFACGDVARPAGSVALAVGDGALAGTAVHRSLVFGL